MLALEGQSCGTESWNIYEQNEAKELHYLVMAIPVVSKVITDRG